MKRIILVFWSIALFAGCNKEKLNNNNLVEGQWKWEESVPAVSPSLIAASTIRPAAGEVYILTFKSNGTFAYALNDAVIKSGSYTIKKNDAGDKWILSYSNQPGLYEITKDNGTLILVSDIPGAGYIKYTKY